MSIAKRIGYTPGPWVMQRGEGEINPKNMTYVCHNNTQCEETTVCNFDENDFRENHEENARLISSSPEMLEALIRMIIESIKDKYWVFQNPEDYFCKEIQIVEKATGKSWSEIKELLDEER